MNFSVIVCTYNRAELLEKLLTSLCRCQINEQLDWEVVAVDNNSSDGTAAVIERFTQRLPIRYYFEDQQGKCHALNRGLVEAQGDKLLFVDDDVEVSPSWLTAFVEAFDRSEYSWFGGRVKPNWGSSKPAWYREETAQAFSGYFGDYDLGLRSVPYSTEDKLPLGASMAVRRDVFDAIGEYRLDLGPRGKLRGVGDETELLMRAIEAGFKGYYIGETQVLHHVGSDRLQLSAYINYGIGKGLNQYRMGVDSERPAGLGIAAWQLVRGIVQLLKRRGDRARLCLINCGIELGRRRAASETT